ncbi:hypothetical protein Vafri_4429 [Volvox africanus]|uniref:Uncharacterized protein n=1 Tax=Volvox africanus TaxID=51714 RepID=A0A8J4AU32_9CHLO|nr:hypothetical protein Vafri_4429 [Volvox africanus]
MTCALSARRIRDSLPDRSSQVGVSDEPEMQSKSWLSKTLVRGGGGGGGGDGRPAPDSAFTAPSPVLGAATAVAAAAAAVAGTREKFPEIWTKIRITGSMKEPSGLRRPTTASTSAPDAATTDRQTGAGRGSPEEPQVTVTLTNSSVGVVYDTNVRVP